MGLIRSDAEARPLIDEDRTLASCQRMQAALGDTHSSVRRQAARELVACPGAAGALASRLICEADPSVREMIMLTLAVLGDTIGIKALTDCLRSDDAALRNGAIEALEQIPDGVAPVIQSLLKDPDPDVRILAVNVLESLRHPAVEQWLLEVLDADAHVNVCANAVNLLAEVGTTASLESLARLKQRFPDEPYIQFATDLAVQRIGKG